MTASQVVHVIDDDVEVRQSLAFLLTLVMTGIDPKTKAFTEPAAAIKHATGTPVKVAVSPQMALPSDNEPNMTAT